MSDKPTEIDRLEAIVIRREGLAAAMERSYKNLGASMKDLIAVTDDYLLAVQTLKLAKIEALLARKEQRELRAEKIAKITRQLG